MATKTETTIARWKAKAKAAEEKGLEIAQKAKDKAKAAVAEHQMDIAVAGGSAVAGGVIGYELQSYLQDPENGMVDSMVTVGFGGIPGLSILGALAALYGLLGRGIKSTTRAALIGGGAGLATGAYLGKPSE